MHTIAPKILIHCCLQERGTVMRKLLCKLCALLEKKLYGEATWEMLARSLYKKEFQLDEARAEIAYLRHLLAQK